MNVIDTHCDALLKLHGDYRDSLRTGKRLLDYRNTDKHYNNVSCLEKCDLKYQFFAIFIAPNIPDNEKWQHAIEQVDCFYNEVIAQGGIVHIRNFTEINELKSDEIGAVLTLEGS